MLGTVPSKPVEIAAPAEVVADRAPRRAGLVAGRQTLAKWTLGIGPRKPAMVSAKPVEPASVPVATLVPDASGVTAKPVRRAGRAAGHINQIKIEAMRMRGRLAETADLEFTACRSRGPDRAFRRAVARRRSRATRACTGASGFQA